MNAHFVALGLDTYFRGNAEEVAFCRKAGAGGNHLVVVTAGGEPVGDGEASGGPLRLRERELAPLLAAFRALPEAVRRPEVPDGRGVAPAERPVPSPPENGLILRAFCRYLVAGEAGWERARWRYYDENPDAWPVEVQSDALWLTEAEWRRLLPEGTAAGERVEVGKVVRRRLFGTVGIDTMEGSVNALEVRDSELVLVSEGMGEGGDLVMRVEGWAAMGRPFDGRTADEARTRGCEVRVVGRVVYRPSEGRIVSFDLGGVGEAWGNKMDYTRREIRVPGERWHYGIALELVDGDEPSERLPPYNLLHYGGAIDYWGE